ncbi:hypothetical protein MDIS_00750 [Mesomycoplasma dispar]|nr:hypothetical protein MDIS_00750 [Mesomycoplasma dispar]
MKAVTLFFNLHFNKPFFARVYLMSVFFLFLLSAFSITISVYELNYTIWDVSLLNKWKKIITYTSISIIFIFLLYFLIKYIRFIKKYKKEATSLTNQQFEEKYKWLLSKSLDKSIFFLLLSEKAIFDMENNLDRIEFKSEKRDFLFKVHYKTFVLHAVFIFITLISLLILTIIIEIFQLKLFWFSIYLGIFVISQIIIVLTRRFLNKISVQLIKNPVELVYNDYKGTVARFFLPKI